MPSGDGDSGAEAVGASVVESGLLVDASGLLVDDSEERFDFDEREPEDFEAFWSPCAEEMAATSCAFFIELAPEIPIPPAIDLRSARRRELSPLERFFAVPLLLASAVDTVDSMVSVT